MNFQLIDAARSHPHPNQSISQQDPAFTKFPELPQELQNDILESAIEVLPNRSARSAFSRVSTNAYSLVAGHVVKLLASIPVNDETFGETPLLAEAIMYAGHDPLKISLEKLNKVKNCFDSFLDTSKDTYEYDGDFIYVDPSQESIEANEKRMKKDKERTFFLAENLQLLSQPFKARAQSYVQEEHGYDGKGGHVSFSCVGNEMRPGFDRKLKNKPAKKLQVCENILMMLAWSPQPKNMTAFYGGSAEWGVKEHMPKLKKETLEKMAENILQNSRSCYSPIPFLIENIKYLCTNSALRKEIRNVLQDGYFSDLRGYEPSKSIKEKIGESQFSSLCAFIEDIESQKEKREWKLMIGQEDAAA